VQTDKVCRGARGDDGHTRRVIYRPSQKFGSAAHEGAQIRGKKKNRRVYSFSATDQITNVF